MALKPTVRDGQLLNEVHQCKNSSITIVTGKPGDTVTGGGRRGALASPLSLARPPYASEPDRVHR